MYYQVGFDILLTDEQSVPYLFVPTSPITAYTPRKLLQLSSLSIVFLENAIQNQDDFDNALIDAVHIRPGLWDMRLSHYKNAKGKEVLWANISEDLQNVFRNGSCSSIN